MKRRNKRERDTHTTPPKATTTTTAVSNRPSLPVPTRLGRKGGKNYWQKIAFIFI
jgi:hypothetical protein